MVSFINIYIGCTVQCQMEFMINNHHPTAGNDFLRWIFKITCASCLMTRSDGSEHFSIKSNNFFSFYAQMLAPFLCIGISGLIQETHINLSLIRMHQNFTLNWHYVLCLIP